MNSRIYIEKKHKFNIEAEELLADLNYSLNLHLDSLRLINIYDVFNVDSKQLNMFINEIALDKVTDKYLENIDLENKIYFAVEFLPGQFDQRAHSAVQCMKIIDNNSEIEVKSGKLLIFENIDVEQLEVIKNYYINKIESREKDLSILENNVDIEIKEVAIIEDFIKCDKSQLNQLLTNRRLAMTLDDLIHIQNYFISENRNPTETEILLLDTYWSDHCRHTTFETILNKIVFPSNNIGEVLQNIFDKYQKLRDVVHQGKKPITLMDLATINAKYLVKIGELDDLEISEEVNACSVYIDVDVDGVVEKWLLMFKNETHNHPTEIEPYGGASTCVGGAIRDPLSGRSYVYQAMRISGSGNPFQDVSETLECKLAQRTISQGSAKGNSAYGNQIGLTTTFVREIVDSSYIAKHLEVGAVVGAVKAENIQRKTPQLGDVIILLGGRTGRDGIGGATGSSKEHSNESLSVSSAEVQKGNAIEERKIQRLFRNKNVTKLIKKCNDFGAGGVAVSIGELADGIEVFLDKVPLKYLGLNGNEIALSESQERMSVVVSSSDAEAFINYAKVENLEAVIVANVTNRNRLEMFWNGEKLVDISRDFINTNGAKQFADVAVEVNAVNFNLDYGNTLDKQIIGMLNDDNIASQKGLVEMFDSTIGATTVLLPYGGKNQLTPAQASVQKIPLEQGNTNTCSILSYGFNPKLASQSPFHSAMYAVIESISKVVAVGGDYRKIKFSFQEYFERLGNDAFKWGKPFQALLGALHIQEQFKLAAIGGKDSMSGTFNDLNVVPTLISFAVADEKVENIISPEFKNVGNYIYIFKHQRLVNGMPNIDGLKSNYRNIQKLIRNGTICSANAIEYGIAESLCKMSFGNGIGFNVESDLNLFEIDYGSIIVESRAKIDNAILLGFTSKDISINKYSFEFEYLKSVWLSKFDSIYKVYNETTNSTISINNSSAYNLKPVNYKIPDVFIPVFPGTNCEYDIAKAFLNAGAKPFIWTFNNQSKDDIENSITIMKDYIDKSDIFVISGGFSAADEPDGSGKYIANILKNPSIRVAIENLLARNGLILGICNGFQALIKCGLLPYGKYDSVNQNSPTLFRNSIGRHVSTIVKTRVMSTASPWLSSFNVNDVHYVPVSHGEGRLIINSEEAKELFANGQIAFTYADNNNNCANSGLDNVNGSDYAIEGIVSKCGKILGKMAHSERVGSSLYKNFPYEIEQDIFVNAVNYFKGGEGCE